MPGTGAFMVCHRPMQKASSKRCQWSAGTCIGQHARRRGDAPHLQNGSDDVNGRRVETVGQDARQKNSRTEHRPGAGRPSSATHQDLRGSGGHIPGQAPDTYCCNQTRRRWTKRCIHLPGEVAFGERGRRPTAAGTGWRGAGDVSPSEPIFVEPMGRVVHSTPPTELICVGRLVSRSGSHIQRARRLVLPNRLPFWGCRSYGRSPYWRARRPSAGLLRNYLLPPHQRAAPAAADAGDLHAIKSLTGCEICFYRPPSTCHQVLDRLVRWVSATIRPRLSHVDLHEQQPDVGRIPPERLEKAWSISGLE